MKSNIKRILSTLSFILFALICCSGFSVIQKIRIPLIMIFGLIEFLLCIKNQKIRFAWSSEIFIFIIFIAIMCIGLGTSLSKVETIKYICIYLSILCMLLNSCDSQFNNKAINLIDKFCKFIAITIIANLFIPTLFRDKLYFLISGGTNAYSKLTTEITNHVYSGIMGEKAEAAYIMVIAIIILLGKCVKNNRFEKKDIVWFVIYTIALILPAKRMLFLLALIIICVYILFWTKMKKRFLYVTAFIIFALCFFIVASKVSYLNTLLTRFSSYSDDSTNNGRVYLWEIANEMFENKPLLGYGFGSYNTYASSKGVVLTADGKWISHAHNIYYQLLAEAGIVGTTVFMLLVLSIIYSILKLIKISTKFSSDDRLLFFIATSLILCTLAYGYTGNCIYYPNQVLVFFWGISMIIYLKIKYKKGVKSNE